MKKLLFIALSATFLSACVSQSSIQEKTAWKLGVDASQVKISNEKNNLSGSTFNADVAGKRYNCERVGNALSMGMFDIECYPVKGK